MVNKSKVDDLQQKSRSPVEITSLPPLFTHTLNFYSMFRMFLLRKKNIDVSRFIAPRKSPRKSTDVRRNLNSEGASLPPR